MTLPTHQEAPMSRYSRYLESVLHHDIPLTREMGLKVLDWQGGQLRLHLPLQANINHKSTMFGGSLYCGAVLAGWGWLHLQLREEGVEDGHIVIQEGQLRYPLPVNAGCDRCVRGAGGESVEALFGDLQALRPGALGAGDVDCE